MDKRMVFRTLLIAVSSMFFVNLVFLGDCGIRSYMSINRDIEAKEEQLCHLNDKIHALRCEIEEWENDKFLVEKAAREDLLLGMKGETVYIIN